MAAFSDEEKRILANVLPGVAAALRSPLNNLHMAAQRLTQGQEGDSAESAIMRQSYYRMLRLVSNLAMGPELLSDKPFQTQNEELVVLLDELCRQADSIAREAGVEVRFDCRERYVVAAVERTYLERLVWNLLSNALKFTPRGGVITVSLEVRSGCGTPAAAFRRSGWRRCSTAGLRDLKPRLPRMAWGWACPSAAALPRGTAAACCWRAGRVRVRW